MADYKVTDTELVSVANAIRTKGGTQAQLEWPTGFVNAVGVIPSGGEANYELLNYIQSDGTQAIDLEMKIPAGAYIIGCVTAISGMSGFKWAFGAKSLVHTLPYCGIQFDNNNNYVNVLYGNGEYYGRKSIYYNSPELFALTSRAANDSLTNIYAFAGGEDNSSGYDDTSLSTQKMHFIEVNGHMFLPCRRKSDSKCGLWDCTNSKFLTDSANGNDFAAGNVLLEFGA